MQNFLITGASSSLGRSFFNILKNEKNNRIFLTSRRKYEFPVCEDCPKIEYLPGVDLLVEDDLLKLASHVDNYFNEPFHIINCVGYYEGQEPFFETSLENARKIFDINYTSVYGVAKAILPIMIAKGGGHFIAFSCNSVKYKYPFMAPFTASKAALESLIGSLANEFAKDHLVANAFALATLNTEPERKMKPFGDHTNWLSVDDVCSLVLNIIDQPIEIMNGNAINLFKYSPSFFHQSYFDRIKHNNLG